MTAINKMETNNKGVEKPLCTVGENVNIYCFPGKHYGVSSKN
jgi:hypothetical protein